MWLHIGANMDQREQVFIGTMTTKGLGVRNVGAENLQASESRIRDTNMANETVAYTKKRRERKGAVPGISRNGFFFGLTYISIRYIMDIRR
jgi:flagellin